MKEKRDGEIHSIWGPDAVHTRSYEDMAKTAKNLDWTRKEKSHVKDEGLPNTRAGYKFMIDDIMKKFAPVVLGYYGKEDASEEEIENLAKHPDFQSFIGTQLQLIWAEDRKKNKMT